MKLITFSLVTASLAMQADTLYMKDGRSFQGTFISGNSREISFLVDRDRTQVFAISGIDRVQFGDESTGTLQPRAESADRGNYSDRRGNSPRTRADDRDWTDDGSRSDGRNTIPTGAVVTVRMIDAIDSNQTDVGNRFRASLDEPLVVEGRTVAPRGADATVEVARVNQSGAVSGREEIALILSEIMANGRRLVPETQHAEVSAKSRGRENVKVVGGTAVVGAIIGAIAGGGKGAAIGAASGAGAGAAVQAIRGQRIQIPSETRLDFTLAQPLRY